MGNGICDFIIENLYNGKFIVLPNMYLISGSHKIINVWDLKNNKEETLTPKLKESCHDGYVNNLEVLSQDEFLCCS